MGDRGAGRMVKLHSNCLLVAIWPFLFFSGLTAFAHAAGRAARFVMNRVRGH